MKLRFFYKILIIFAVSFITVYTSASFAQEKKPAVNKNAPKSQKNKDNEQKHIIDWELYSSDSGVFNVRFPIDYKYKIYNILVNDSSSAYAEEVVASLASELSPDDIKNYLVEMHQTLGKPLAASQMRKYLDNDAKTYEALAKQNNGELVTNEDFQHFGFLGKNIYITYTDSSLGENALQALRVSILYTNTAKIQMVLTGSPRGMYSQNNNSFFESIRLSDGHGKPSIDKKENWEKLSDANNIFSLVIPPRHAIYRPDPVRYKLSKRISSAHTIFYDPIINQKMFYNVYAYKIGTPIKDKMVKKIIFSQHISKFVTGAQEDSLKLTFSTKNQDSVASTQIIIEPKEDIPYVDAVRLRASYRDGYIVVQEITGSQNLALGDFSTVLLESLEFHPENFKETTVEEIIAKNKAFEEKKNSKKESPSKTEQKLGNLSQESSFDINGIQTEEPSDTKPKTTEKKEE